MSIHDTDNELIFEGAYRSDHEDGHLIGNIEDRSRFKNELNSLNKIIKQMSEYSLDSDTFASATEDFAGMISGHLEDFGTTLYREIRELELDENAQEFFEKALEKALNIEYDFYNTNK